MIRNFLIAAILLIPGPVNPPQPPVPLSGSPYEIFCGSPPGPCRWTQTAAQPAPTGTGGPGSPVILTYGFVPDMTPINTAGVCSPCGTWSLLQTSLDQHPVLGTVWRSLVHQAASSWTQSAGVSLQFVPQIASIPNVADPVPTTAGTPQGLADIRIAGTLLDGPGGLLASAWAPDQGDIVLDLDPTDLSLVSDPSGGFRRFRNLIAHEFGHALGLQHICPECTNCGTAPCVNCHQRLMDPRPHVLTIDGPEDDDFRGIHRLYGDRNENNDALADATNLGILPGAAPNNTRVIEGLSVDDVADVDFLRWQVEDCRLLRITVVPTGTSFDHEPGCTGQSVSLNPRTILALSLELRDGGGSILGAGSALPGSAIIVPASSSPPIPLRPGSFHVRITGAGNPPDVQRYRLELRLDPDPAPAGGPILILSQAAEPGSLLIRLACGQPLQPYFTAFSLEPANAGCLGTGWWFGLHVSLPFLVTQYISGTAPFVGFLDGNGDSAFLFPAGSLSVLAGQTVAGISMTLDPVTFLPIIPGGLSTLTCVLMI